MADLGDIADFKNGKALSKEKYLASGQWPVYGSNGEIARTDDILNSERVISIGRVGAYCGAVYAIRTKSWVTDNAIIAEPKEGTDYDFLYYLLSSLQLNRTAIGSAQPLLTQGGLKVISLPEIPNYEQQKVIGKSLKALDDKIELNNQINETLESMAKAIFKEWFIDFGPVKTKAEGKKIFGMDAKTASLFPDSFEDSELGQIPKGWEVKNLGESCDLLMGQSPPGETYNECGNGMVFYQGRAEFGSRFPSPRLFCTEPSRIVDKGTVLLSVRAPVGDLNISTEEKTCIGRGLAGILHKAGGTTYTYYFLQSLKDKFDMYNGEGTVFGSINKETLSGLKIISPPEVVLGKFLELVRPLDDLYFSNFVESRSLTQARDLLLQKLISGEITLEGI